MKHLKTNRSESMSVMKNWRHCSSPTCIKFCQLARRLNVEKKLLKIVRLHLYAIKKFENGNKSHDLTADNKLQRLTICSWLISHHTLNLFCTDF